MDHDITVRGEAYSLRPVTIDDAEFIVKIRTDPELSKLIHPTSPSVEDQRNWITALLTRPEEWFFIVTNNRDDSPEGTICIYNVDTTSNRAEWGRWVMQRGSLGALESAIHIYDVGFDQLGLAELYGHTDSANLPVVSFHTSIGSIKTGMVNGPLGEVWVEQTMHAQDWPQQRPRVYQLARRLATKAEMTT